ncbi:hypothetical protein ACFSTC_49890 [Nonomuraea ferruginea]
MALIVLAADKGAPGVTTAATALAAVWPRPVLLAECDPAGGDLAYRLPAVDGGVLNPGKGLLTLGATARRGLDPAQIPAHTQKVIGGLDVLVGLTHGEQAAGLTWLWGPLGRALAGIPEADVIADCGRAGRPPAARRPDGRGRPGGAARPRHPRPRRPPARAPVDQQGPRRRGDRRPAQLPRLDRGGAPHRRPARRLRARPGPRPEGRRAAARPVGRQARPLAAHPHRTRPRRTAGDPMIDHALVKRFRQEVGDRLAHQRRLDQANGMPPDDRGGRAPVRPRADLPGAGGARAR